MKSPRDVDIQYIKGIGPKKATLLAEELKIRTAYDLLHHFPTHYLDRSQIYRISSLGGEMPAAIQLRGRFVSFTVHGEGAKRRLVGLFTDGTATIEVVWFQRINQLKELYRTATEYILFGRPQEFNRRWSIVHPEIESPDAYASGGRPLRGVYPLTEKLRNRGVTAKMIYTWVQNAFAAIGTIADPLPPELIDRLKLMPLGEALQQIHNPTDMASLQRARERLKFEELFYLQLNIQRYSNRHTAALQGYPFPRIGQYFNSFYSQVLPFQLTGAQKRVLREIRTDVGSGRQMNRLVQGDVGSGKTIVALMSMLMALDNGHQAALMAPTEILATQHYESLRALAAPLGINMRLLTGSTRKRERDEIHSQLLDGTLHILVGTHALIEDKVKFRSLGMVVIDEQHRFGVMQRARLWSKSARAPHVLVMTATPIPRTLAMTLYGDLDVSVIDELPPGRKPIETMLRYDDQRLKVYQSIARQLAMGRQAYIVYPLIQENEKLDLRSLEEGYEIICENFPSYRTAYVHGRMKPDEKEAQMQKFVSGKAQILVATTVIEVGVNVPNASVMLIENAERFGLSQLHQLRGRVGRGADQSYCILMSKRNIGADTRKRLELMTSTSDGFVIAEADLKMRGPGDLEGTMQSGIPFALHIANLATDGNLVQLARDSAIDLLDADPSLSLPRHLPLLTELQALYAKPINLGRIS